MASASPTSSSVEVAYRAQVGNTRGWLTFSALLNLIVVMFVLSGAFFVRLGYPDWSDTLALQGALLSVLVAFGVILGASPRPWLTLGVLLYTCADTLSFIAIWADPDGSAKVAIPFALVSMVSKAGLWLALWRTFALQRALAKEATELPQGTGLPAGLALVALSVASVAHGAVLGERGAKRRVAASSRECRGNLRGWYTAEKAYFQEHDRYELDLTKLGFMPERGNRYSYYDSRTGPYQARTASTLPTEGPLFGVQSDEVKHGPKYAAGPELIPAHLAGGLPLGLSCSGPSDCPVTAVCIRRLPEEDGRIDVWSISTQPRKADDGEDIPEGVSYHETGER